MSHSHFLLLLAVLIIGALGLMALTLSGYGAPDHSDRPAPRLPGHDVDDALKRRSDPDQPS